MRDIGAMRGGIWLAAVLMVLFGSWITLGSTAYAIDECGPAAASVTCNPPPPPVDLHPGGVTYTNPGFDMVLTVNNGFVIDRSAAPVDDARGIEVTDTSGVALTVNLTDGVSIATNGLHADGVGVVGFGDISITSAADITVLAVGGDKVGTNGLLGRIDSLVGTGDIDITQSAGSTITVTGPYGSGLYGRNEGTGSVTATSSGAISTAGDAGYGINAWVLHAGGLNTTVRLNATGTVFTNGQDSVGLYSLNAGHGDALIYVDGKVTTLGEGSDGALADIDDQNNPSGISQVVLSNTASVHTGGDYAKGAWSLNWGLGDSILRSAATVTTDGIESHGLVGEIRLGHQADPLDPADVDDHYRVGGSRSTANLYIDLAGNGSVVTNGEGAHGIFARNGGGDGAATVTMASGTAVTTKGNLANGVNGLSGGTMVFTQAAGSTVRVSGVEAFGVNLESVMDASADLRGTVSATGEFGVGASVFSTTQPANIVIGANTTVTGGWQADIAGLGTTTLRPSAGVLIGSGGGSSQLTNLGVIGAGSDRAIADIGRLAAPPVAASGNLTIDNSGRITGFVELAAGGSNIFNNAGLFDVRHFADTNGDDARDTKRVAISDFGEAPNSTFNNNAGAMVRLAPVSGEKTVDAASYYVPTVGLGSLALETSFYDLNRAGVVQGQFTNLGTFNNAGIIDLRGTAIGNTLVMTSNNAAGGIRGASVFVSDGGQLLLNTFFNEGVALGGATGSYSDVLIVDSTQLGLAPTGITIGRREGPGAVTPGNGILVVEVRDKAASAAGVFALNGDYIDNGEQVVIGGANRYALFHNGVAADVADGNWYLRNMGLSPNVPVYEEYPKILVPLVEVPTLQQRVGNRYWIDPSQREPQTVFCKDPARNFRCAVTDEQAAYYLDHTNPVTVDGTGVWGRIEAGRAHFVSPSSVAGAVADSEIWRLQAGVDTLLMKTDDGSLFGGLTAQYGHVGADITAPGAAGSINANGYGLGGTLTWYANNGFYADAQVQANWFGSTLHSTTAAQTLVNDNRGFGAAVSLEAGQRIALDPHWGVTPQAQLTFSSINFDTFTDPFGTTVSLMSGESLMGRLGLATEYQNTWREQNGETARLSAYGVANLYHEFLDGTQVSISGTQFSSRDDRLWGGLGLGGSYEWADGKYALHGEISARTSLENFGDSYEAGATLGLRVKW